MPQFLPPDPLTDLAWLARLPMTWHRPSMGVPVTDHRGGSGGLDRLLTKTTCTVWHRCFHGISVGSLLTVVIGEVNCSKTVVVILIVV